MHEKQPDQQYLAHRRVRSRVTERNCSEAVDLYTSGLSALDVSERLGLGKSTVLRILKHKGVDIRPRGKHVL